MRKGTRKQPFLTPARAKLLERVGIFAAVALFAILALINREQFCSPVRAADTRVEVTQKPIAQVYQIEAALKEAGFTRSSETLIWPNETEWPFALQADSYGVAEIEWIVPLFEESNGASEVDQLFNRQNAAFRQMLLAMMESLYPVLGGTVVDAEAFVQGCEATLKSGKSKTFYTSDFALQIYPDQNGLRILMRRVSSDS